jgi:hypothetical protein
MDRSVMELVSSFELVAAATSWGGGGDKPFDD